MTLNEFMKANGLKLVFGTNGAPWRELVLYAHLTNKSGGRVSMGGSIVRGEGSTERQATENLLSQLAGNIITVTTCIEVPMSLV